MASVISKRKGKKDYYYLVESARVNGKPRIVSQVYLGTTDRILNMVKGNKIRPERFSVLEFGSTAAIFKILMELKINTSIDTYAKSNGRITVGDRILIAAVNRAIHPVSHSRLPEWYSHSFMKILYPSSKKILSGQNYWNNTHGITVEMIASMQGNILSNLMSIADTHDLFFDTTNFPTFLDQASYSGSIARKTHSKAHRNDLLHVALWLLVDSRGIPLLHGMYEANRNDVRVFGDFLELMKGYREFSEKVESITLVFDKGNNNGGNIDGMVHHYIGALRPSTQKDILKIPLDKYTGLNDGTKYYRTTIPVYGKDHAAVITYNPHLASKKMSAFDSKLQKCRKFMSDYIDGANRSKRKRVIEKMKTVMDGYLREKRMDRFIEYEISGDGSFSLNVKERVDLVDFMFGKNIIFTDRLDMDTVDIINRYKDRWIIEDSFKKMNHDDNISVTPIYSWTDQQIAVHIFVCVIALLGLRVLGLKIKDSGLEMSVESALDILGNVHAVGTLYEKRRIEWNLSEMDDDAKKLIELLDLKTFFDRSVGNTEKQG